MTSRRPSAPVSRRAVLTGLAGGGVGSVLLATGNHVAAQDATPAASADDVRAEYGVAYGNDDRDSQVLDVYLPTERDAPRPAIMLFHGGAWTYGLSGRGDFSLTALALARAGYVAFNVEYRRTRDPVGEYRWPDQLDDVQQAARWVRAHAERYNVDPDRIGAFGHSAGAHLASMLGTRETRDDADAALAGISSRVSCVVALAGHFDLSIPYPQEFDRNAIATLVGGTLDEVPDAYRDASPVTWVDADSAPFLIIHGGSDDAPFPMSARSMVDALHDAAVDVVYAEFARGDHFSVAGWPTAGPWTLTFLDAYLQPER
jgi:acetyl esterase/lipase